MTRLDAIDALHQIRDEMEVVWLALGNTADQGDEGPPLAIREHVHGLQRRIGAICKALDRGNSDDKPAPVRMVGGERS